jgi:hypothetical protein
MWPAQLNITNTISLDVSGSSMIQTPAKRRKIYVILLLIIAILISECKHICFAWPKHVFSNNTLKYRIQNVQRNIYQNCPRSKATGVV